MLSQSPERAAPANYLLDLERSGLAIQRWQLDTIPRPGAPNDGAGALRYTSWSDGDLGLFVTDTRSSLSVDGDAINDFLAIGISSANKHAQLDPVDTSRQSGLPAAIPSHEIWMRYYRKGSPVRVAISRIAPQTVTLCVTATALHRWAGHDLPVALRAAMDDEEVLLRSSVQIERERDHLIELPADPPYAALLYRTKSSTLLWLLLDYLRRCDAEARNEDKVISDRVRGRLESVRRRLDEAPEQRLTVDEMARRAGLNRTSLRALFKQVYGMRLSDYRTAELMRRAERMLHAEHRSVTETAHTLGYSGASSFSVAYKRHFGHPPGHAGAVEHVGSAKPASDTYI